METPEDKANKYNLPKEIVENVDLLMSIDHETIGSIVQCAFIAGMELAMRICRSRSEDCAKTGISNTSEFEALICSQLIRNVQVEIGAGRMKRPTFTKEELEEMDRIS